jgi:glycosyltransferase involved in cell wall biosynthesis
MPTILHLITGLETGGAEGMLVRLVRRTDRDRFTSVVVSMTDAGKLGSMVMDSGVELRTLGMPHGVPDPRGLRQFGRILRQLRPDILQTWLYHADLLGLVARQLGYVSHLVWNIRCTESVGSTVIRRILGWGSRVPDIVIVNSLSGKCFHRRTGYRARRWEQIPNGFDTRALLPDLAVRTRVRGELGIDDHTIAIGLPARFHPMKDHATFLAAAAKLAADRRKVVFVLIGAGIKASNRALTTLIAAHGLADRVLLLGERRDIAAIYPALDIVALSSAFGEGFPNVLGEAMCCGVPCVATDSGDASEILGPTGAIVPPRDAAALAAALDRIITLDPQARRAMGLAGRLRIAEAYDLGSIVARYENLYDEILAAPSRPASAR